jgi:hypothetical protein
MRRKRPAISRLRLLQLQKPSNPIPEEMGEGNQNHGSEGLVFLKTGFCRRHGASGLLQTALVGALMMSGFAPTSLPTTGGISPGMARQSSIGLGRGETGCGMTEQLLLAVQRVLLRQIRFSRG